MNEIFNSIHMVSRTFVQILLTEDQIEKLAQDLQHLTQPNLVVSAIRLAIKGLTKAIIAFYVLDVLPFSFKYLNSIHGQTCDYNCQSSPTIYSCSAQCVQRGDVTVNLVLGLAGGVM